VLTRSRTDRSTFVGDLSGRWLAGSYALIETGISAKPQSIAAPNSMYEFPANGYPNSSPHDDFCDLGPTA
jgi:hypothetical protein